MALNFDEMSSQYLADHVGTIAAAFDAPRCAGRSGSGNLFRVKDECPLGADAAKPCVTQEGVSHRLGHPDQAAATRSERTLELQYLKEQSAGWYISKIQTVQEY